MNSRQVHLIIIKWAKAADYEDDAEHNIVAPVFNGVIINNAANYYDNNASGDLRVRFLGTYKYTTFNSDDKSFLFMGTDDKLYYPKNGASIGACRAYFKIGEDGALLARQLTAFNIDFGKDETTGISSISKESGSEGVATGWYTLDGRKLSGKPKAKGLYINNGKKVVVK